MIYILLGNMHAHVAQPMLLLSHLRLIQGVLFNPDEQKHMQHIVNMGIYVIR